MATTPSSPTLTWRSMSSTTSGLDAPSTRSMEQLGKRWLWPPIRDPWRWQNNKPVLRRRRWIRTSPTSRSATCRFTRGSSSCKRKSRSWSPSLRMVSGSFRQRQKQIHQGLWAAACYWSGPRMQTALREQKPDWSSVAMRTGMPLRARLTLLLQQRRGWAGLCFCPSWPPWNGTVGQRMLALHSYKDSLKNGNFGWSFQQQKLWKSWALRPTLGCSWRSLAMVSWMLHVVGSWRRCDVSSLWGSGSTSWTHVSSCCSRMTLWTWTLLAVELSVTTGFVEWSVCMWMTCWDVATSIRPSMARSRRSWRKHSRSENGRPLQSWSIVERHWRRKKRPARGNYIIQNIFGKWNPSPLTAVADPKTTWRRMRWRSFAVSWGHCSGPQCSRNHTYSAQLLS